MLSLDRTTGVSEVATTKADLQHLRNTMDGLMESLSSRIDGPTVRDPLCRDKEHPMDIIHEE
jgi:hypothetical protein